ncbi:MAG: hypothetical protein ABWZ66_10430 [Pyrinomonadaceae bacterium]
MILRLFTNRTEPVELNFGFLGIPFSGLLAAFGGGTAILFSLTGIALNYIALFSVVNFIRRLYSQN